MNEFKITESTQGILRVDTKTDISVQGLTTDGCQFRFDAFRDTHHSTGKEAGPEHVFANSSLGLTQDDTIQSTHVRIPNDWKRPKNTPLSIFKSINVSSS